MALDDSMELNLPDMPDFISTPPVYSCEEMIKICEAMLPYWNALRLKNPPPVLDLPEFKLW